MKLKNTFTTFCSIVFLLGLTFFLFQAKDVSGSVTDAQVISSDTNEEFLACLDNETIVWNGSSWTCQSTLSAPALAKKVYRELE